MVLFPDPDNPEGDFVAHRVDAIGIDADGSQYLQTKGDLNAEADTFLIKAEDVLATLQLDEEASSILESHKEVSDQLRYVEAAGKPNNPTDYFISNLMGYSDDIKVIFAENMLGDFFRILESSIYEIINNKIIYGNTPAWAAANFFIAKAGHFPGTISNTKLAEALGRNRDWVGKCRTGKFPKIQAKTIVQIKNIIDNDKSSHLAAIFQAIDNQYSDYLGSYQTYSGKANENLKDQLSEILGTIASLYASPIQERSRDSLSKNQLYELWEICVDFIYTLEEAIYIVYGSSRFIAASSAASYFIRPRGNNKIYSERLSQSLGMNPNWIEDIRAGRRRGVLLETIATLEKQLDSDPHLVTILNQLPLIKAKLKNQLLIMRQQWWAPKFTDDPIEYQSKRGLLIHKIENIIRGALKNSNPDIYFTEEDISYLIFKDALSQRDDIFSIPKAKLRDLRREDQKNIDLNLNELFNFIYYTEILTPYIVSQRLSIIKSKPINAPSLSDLNVMSFKIRQSIRQYLNENPRTYIRNHMVYEIKTDIELFDLCVDIMRAYACSNGGVPLSIYKINLDLANDFKQMKPPTLNVWNTIKEDLYKFYGEAMISFDIDLVEFLGDLIVRINNMDIKILSRRADLGRASHHKIHKNYLEYQRTKKDQNERYLIFYEAYVSTLDPTFSRKTHPDWWIFANAQFWNQFAFRYNEYISDYKAFNKKYGTDFYNPNFLGLEAIPSHIKWAPIDFSLSKHTDQKIVDNRGPKGYVGPDNFFIIPLYWNSEDLSPIELKDLNDKMKIKINQEYSYPSWSEQAIAIPIEWFEIFLEGYDHISLIDNNELNYAFLNDNAFTHYRDSASKNKDCDRKYWETYALLDDDLRLFLFLRNWVWGDGWEDRFLEK
ncbi:MAG: hypothetical protein BAJALOKI1v1_800008 [Promethearchaeota archaeon]|nr:MAG: hypothetical protein BAJALOKI1v1_800008 [Candidatus Lokiarchaeota archaeon]